MSEHFFYDKPILREREQEKIEEILAEFKKEKADETLKEKIWEKLQKAKADGIISIPFKVVLVKGSEPHIPPCVEVVLDTKV
jgi:hypothetical protein